MVLQGGFFVGVADLLLRCGGGDGEGGVVVLCFWEALVCGEMWVGDKRGVFTHGGRLDVGGCWGGVLRYLGRYFRWEGKCNKRTQAAERQGRGKVVSWARYVIAIFQTRSLAIDVAVFHMQGRRDN